MVDKQSCCRFRKEFNVPAIALLIYYVIMNVVVTVAVFADALLTMQSGDLSMDQAIERASQNGWGYILATLIGAAILLLWRKRQFCFHDIWKKGGSMTPSSFGKLFCIFVSGQALFQILAAVMEWLLDLFGLSILRSLEMASFTTDSLSMFLYVTLMAPVFEEILFRGWILRTLEPYGKKFAILASAFLFGIFHGNPVQTPYAFAVGLVLGYVTIEYSLLWAVLLHLINNFVLGDALPRLMMLLTDWIGELIWFAVIWGSAIAALAILVVNRRKIAEYFRCSRIDPLCVKVFFTSPWVLVLSGVMIVSMSLLLFIQ